MTTRRELLRALEVAAIQCPECGASPHDVADTIIRTDHEFGCRVRQYLARCTLWEQASKTEPEPTREYVVDVGPQDASYNTTRYFSVDARSEAEAVVLATAEYAKQATATVVQVT